MAKCNQVSTGTQGSLDKSAKTGENVGFELTEDELNKVSGGMRKASSGGGVSSGASAFSGLIFLRFD